MKIAIDCSKAVNESAGVANYTRELTQNLIELYPKDDFFLFFNFLRGKERKQAKIRQLVGGRNNVKHKVYPLPGGIKEMLFSSSFSILNYWTRGNDLYHATEFLNFDNKLNIPQILTVHDLTMIKFPQHRGSGISGRHGRMLRRACENASTIISISNTTRNDIISYFKTPPAKIKVIYNGVGEVFRPLKDKKRTRAILKEKYRIDFPYILFVGTIEPRKNIANLLKAFAKLSSDQEFRNYHLILIGKKGWNTAEIETTYHSLSVRPKIHFLNYISESDLPLFYNCASLFCYPSLYEGFGLPPLEAMACGTPVLTSDISSLPEITGKAARLVSPVDYEAVFQGMKKVLSDKNLLLEMKQLGLMQARKFSWRKCAQETHGVYEEILKNEKNN